MEREILVHMYEWVLMRYKILSLTLDKWVSSPVVKMMARTLTADHRYYFDTTFRFFVPIYEKRYWRAYVVNVRDRWIELLDSLDGR